MLLASIPNFFPFFPTIKSQGDSSPIPEPATRTPRQLFSVNNLSNSLSLLEPLCLFAILFPPIIKMNYKQSKKTSYGIKNNI